MFPTNNKQMIQISDLDCDEKLFDFYLEEELNYFWWPTNEERISFWKKYQDLSVEERKKLLDSIPWDFETVFSEIGSGEYTINGCELMRNNRARLYFFVIFNLYILWKI